MTSPTPSNKSVIDISKGKETGAICSTGTTDIVLKIDKLSLTLSAYTQKEEKEMIGAALQLVDGGWGQKVYLRNGYKLNILVPLPPTNERVLYSWVPTIASRPYFRIEFNPSKLQTEGIAELIYCDIVLLLNLGAGELYGRAKVSRIDIAIDLGGVSIKNLLVFSDYAVRSTKYDRSGDLETIYLGSQKSPAQTRIYDKVAEMIAKGLTVSSAHPITRIERVARNKGLLKNLAKMKNPLSTLHLGFPANKPDGIPTHTWAMFCSYAREHTTQAALAMLPKSERGKFKAAMKLVEPDWWDTAVIWQQWPALIDHVGLVPQGPFYYGKVE